MGLNPQYCYKLMFTQLGLNLEIDLPRREFNA